MACIFCKIVAGEAPASRVHEDERFLAFMDIHPWRPGHVLVIPKQHAQRLSELADEAHGALFGLGVWIAAGIRRSALPCDDIGFVLNDGPAANQTIPHAHLHLLPRTRGDLWRLGGQLLRRPLVPFLPPAPRATLDRQAAMISGALY